MKIWQLNAPNKLEHTVAPDLKTENGKVEGIYDLSGRKLEQVTQPGIYIINGKKTFIK